MTILQILETIEDASEDAIHSNKGSSITDQPVFLFSERYPRCTTGLYV